MIENIRNPSKALVLAIHERSIELYGGASGLRDEGGLDASLARPEQILAYDQGGQVALFDLCAALCMAIVKIHHPFVDGNKRTGAASMGVMLELNGCHIDVSNKDMVETILGLAAGDISEVQLRDWIAANSFEK